MAEFMTGMKRTDYCGTLRSADIGRTVTVCGWVQNIGRKGQKHRLLTLAQLQNETVDMFTTVFIGNAFTQNCAGRMVTARGYNTQ